MILFVGIPSEPPLAMAIAAAKDRGVSYYVFNQRDSLSTNLVIGGQGNLEHVVLLTREEELNLSECQGAYTRMTNWRSLPELSSYAKDSPEFKHVEGLNQGLGFWLDWTPARVFNRSRAMATNSSKPYQAQIIVQAGFKTPITLVTNDPTMVKAFAKVHRRVVFKSISGIRSIVKELSGPAWLDIERIRQLPTQFQAYVDGTNIRVHVAGNQLFATEIVSEAVDYRYAGQDALEVEMQPLQLPEEIEKRCFQLSQLLNLPLCGIDLKRTLDGDYYCFEVNPSPAYSYYEHHTGQPISSAIVEALTW